MDAPLSSIPMIGVYRTADCSWFLLMHMALVDPGHYVGWSRLDLMGRVEASSSSLKRVLDSLKEFPSRDGADKQFRLNLKGFEPLHVNHDLVRIKLISPDSLKLIPHRRGTRQHEPLELEATIVATAISPEEFFNHLEVVFLKGQGSHPSP